MSTVPNRGGERQAIRYTAKHMDRLIDALTNHRHALRRAGRIDEVGNYVGRPQEAAAPPVEPPTHSAHCVKCKSKKTIQTEAVNKMSNGAHQAVGKCPDCGTPTYAFHSAANGQALADRLKEVSGG